MGNAQVLPDGGVVAGWGSEPFVTEFAPGGAIRFEAVMPPGGWEPGLPLTDETPLGSGGGFEERVEAFQRRLIVDALAKSNGNQAAAARLLGLSYHQFRYYRGRLVAGD